MQNSKFNIVRFMNDIQFAQTKRRDSDSHHEFDVEETTFEGKKALYVTAYLPAEGRIDSRYIAVLDPTAEYKRLRLTDKDSLRRLVFGQQDDDTEVTEIMYNGRPAAHVIVRSFRGTIIRNEVVTTPLAQ